MLKWNSSALMQFWFCNSYNPAAILKFTNFFCCGSKMHVMFFFGIGSTFSTHSFAFAYRTLSALAHWSSIFAETPYIPLLAFPFVKLFQNNQLICFEVVATVVGKQRFKKLGYAATCFSFPMQKSFSCWNEWRIS